MRASLFPVSPIVVALSFVMGCGNDAQSAVVPGQQCASYNPLRDPYFGDTHVHTNLSLDANLNGTRPGPDEAYAFARDGVEIGLQPYDAQGNPSRTAQIARPLDFVMLSDHAEFLGTVSVCQDPDSEPYDHPDCVEFREDPNRAFFKLNASLANPPQSATYPTLCGEGGQACIEAGMDVWRSVQQSAEAAYDRSEACEFTSFVGYEWSAVPGGKNLHRNIIFRNEIVPDAAIGYFDAPYVEQLYESLYSDCLNADNDCEAFAIPHNSNLAGGIFFEDRRCNGEPFNEDYVATRNAREPIIELYQHKGASECLPGEPIPDELCGFESLPFENIAAANQVIFGPPNPKDVIRSAFGEGMKLEESLGVNPFKHGLISATDTHISAPGFDEEATFRGHGGAGQSNRDLFPEGFPDIKYLSPGGLAGVWAEENSRGALFDAMQRKETFATSGSRIIPRFFGGWDLPSNLCDNPSFVEVGYEQGVPMGGDLFEAAEGATPKFIVSAKQDAEAAPLQRIQIIKGWVEDGESQVQIYEVAGNPNNGASVDLETCTPQGEGFADLCTVWEDPDFDPAQRAYYYARIVENPACRWTTIQCVEADYDCENPSTAMDADCCDPTSGLNVDWCDLIDCSEADQLPPAEAQCCKPRVEPIVQERAWTSPIWYSPEEPSVPSFDPIGIAEECSDVGGEFQQEAKYEMVCAFESIGQVFDLNLTITVKASVEPDGTLTEGVEANVTHSASMLMPLIATLPNLAPDARISLATVGLSLSNASPSETQNELEGVPVEVVPEFALNTVETGTTADGSGRVTLELIAFEFGMTGLVTGDGTELVPGGESLITQDSEECTPIALAPGTEPISFEIVSP